VSEATLTAVPTELEAELVCGLLRANGIACFIRRTGSAGVVFAETLAAGAPCEVVVGDADLTRAREVLAAQSGSA